MNTIRHAFKHKIPKAQVNIVLLMLSKRSVVYLAVVSNMETAFLRRLAILSKVVVIRSKLWAMHSKLSPINYETRTSIACTTFLVSPHKRAIGCLGIVPICSRSRKCVIQLFAHIELEWETIDILFNLCVQDIIPYRVRKVCYRNQICDI